MPLPIAFRKAMIVEDHPLFSDALAMTLRAVAGIEQVVIAERLQRALDLIALGERPDIVVLDLTLPDVNGLDGLTRLRAVEPQVPILIVSSIDDPRVIRAAVQGGASGFLPKHSRRDLFRAAFAALSQGEIFMPDAAGDTLLRTETLNPQTEAQRRLSHLTRQQANILDQICAGKMNKQIAFDLSIAETTVKAHVTAIMRKLGVYSRTQAVLLAREAQASGPLPESWFQG